MDTISNHPPAAGRSGRTLTASAEIIPFNPEWAEPEARFLRPELPAPPALPLDDVFGPIWAAWIKQAAEAKAAWASISFSRAMTLRTVAAYHRPSRAVLMPREGRAQSAYGGVASAISFKYVIVIAGLSAISENSFHLLFPHRIADAQCARSSLAMHGSVKATNADLARLARCSITTVARAIEDLSNTGAIEVMFPKSGSSAATYALRHFGGLPHFGEMQGHLMRQSDDMEPKDDTSPSPPSVGAFAPTTHQIADMPRAVERPSVEPPALGFQTMNKTSSAGKVL